MKNKILLLVVATSVAIFFSSCEKDELDALSEDSVKDIEMNAEVPDSIPEMLYLTEEDSMALFETAMESRAGLPNRYQVRAYLYCYRPSDNTWTNTKDEIYFKRTSVYVPKNGPFRNGAWDASRTIKRRGNPDIWEMGRSSGRTITVFDTYDPFIPYFPAYQGMLVNDKVTVSLTVAEQDNAQMPSISLWIITATKAAVNVASLLLGGGEIIPWSNVKKDIQNAITSTYYSLRRDGDEVIGTVQFNVADNKLNSVKRLEITGDAALNGYKTGSGSNWVEFRLNGARSLYKLRLTLVKL